MPSSGITSSGPNTLSSSPSSSCSPSAAFASATLANLSNNNMNGNGPSSLPPGLPSGIPCSLKPDDDMDLAGSTTTASSIIRSSWSANPTPTPPRITLPTTNLPPNITEGPPPLEQTAPVSLTTKSNVPPLLKVRLLLHLNH